MIIRRHGLLYKALYLVPLRRSPFLLLSTRLGLNTTDYVRVVWRTRT